MTIEEMDQKINMATKAINILGAYKKSPEVKRMMDSYKYMRVQLSVARFSKLYEEMKDEE